MRYHGQIFIFRSLVCLKNNTAARFSVFQPVMDSFRSVNLNCDLCIELEFELLMIDEIIFRGSQLTKSEKIHDTMPKIDNHFFNWLFHRKI